MLLRPPPRPARLPPPRPAPRPPSALTARPAPPAQCEVKHSVYVYKCENSVLQVKGKVNKITVDACKKFSIVCNTVVAGIEVVDGNGVKVQLTGAVKQIQVDKCSGTQLIMNEESLDAEIISAKCDSLNVIVPAKSADEDYKEHAIPEQFVSTYDAATGKYSTVSMAHAA